MNTESAFPTGKKTISAVSSYNEWDPLEEVVVGTIEGVTIPPLTHEMKVMVRRDYWDFYREHAGEPYPEHLIRGAAKALDNLQQVLEDEGVKVTRPERGRLRDQDLPDAALLVHRVLQRRRSRRHARRRR